MSSRDAGASSEPRMGPAAYEPLPPPGPAARESPEKPSVSGFELLGGLALGLGTPFLFVYLFERWGLWRLGPPGVFSAVAIYVFGLVAVAIWAKRSGKPGLRVGIIIGGSLWLIFLTACGLIIWAIFSGGGI